MVSVVLSIVKWDDDSVSKALTAELSGRRGFLGGLRGHRVPPAFEALDTRNLLLTPFVRRTAKGIESDFERFYYEFMYSMLSAIFSAAFCARVR